MRTLVLLLTLFCASLLVGCSEWEDNDFGGNFVTPCAEASDWRYGYSMLVGNVRRVELWIPDRLDATAEEIRNGSVGMRRQVFWFITHDDDPTQILLPCNLPENFKEDRLRVEFSGNVLKPETNSSGLSGVDPFSLSYIDIYRTDDDDNW
jgi:hypothetical protein